MFIGHYGPALVARAVVKSVPLWVLFVAAQWVDFVWAALVLAGLEKVRIVENFLGRSPLDLYYMPFSHGLPAAVLLSFLAGGLAALFWNTHRLAVILAVAATSFSHWLADLLVHRPDLPLVFDDMKVGFGIWAEPLISVPLELAFLGAGLWIYDRAVPSPRAAGTVALWLFGFALAALQVQNTFFATHPANPAEFAQLALIAYVAIAVLAALVDYLRRPRT